MQGAFNLKLLIIIKIILLCLTKYKLDDYN